MDKELKIVICGGGSTYTPGIVKDLLDQRQKINIKELWLYDIDEERQNKVALIVKEVIKSYSEPKRSIYRRRLYHGSNESWWSEDESKR